MSEKPILFSGIEIAPVYTLRIYDECWLDVTYLANVINLQMGEQGLPNRYLGLMPIQNTNIETVKDWMKGCGFAIFMTTVFQDTRIVEIKFRLNAGAGDNPRLANP